MAKAMIYRRDYRPHPYVITQTFLDFKLDAAKTVVTATSVVCRRRTTRGPLVLAGRQLELVSVEIEGKLLKAKDFRQTSEQLIIKTLPSRKRQFTLAIKTIIHPAKNLALEGLYQSGHILCTQNEPEGMRRITYFIDRPDNLVRFKVRLTARQDKYPCLLSNGNLVAEGKMGKWHFAEWKDPIPKPCYLLAVVAGKLDFIEDYFVTAENRKVTLRIFCDPGRGKYCGHAMTALKAAMRWDEVMFGRCYDLDIFMIVAVDAFNMGAMENKGLNIFNAAYVLADPQTATDQDYLKIFGVIGHEYFHNWTGNRITCRDWFQLTLKEGLTVFRDQEFSASQRPPALQRWDDVQLIKNVQFAEDASPLAHPIRPNQYQEINNFYTTTIYDKGAEVIRMLQTFLGKQKFREGMDRYFALFDGQAVTTDDFLAAVTGQLSRQQKAFLRKRGFSAAQLKAPAFALAAFKNWYQQAGTPRVTVQARYDEKQQTLTLKVQQKNEALPPKLRGGEKPFYFPLGLGLWVQGERIPLQLKDRAQQKAQQDFLAQGVLAIKNRQEKFVLQNVAARPVLSLLRNFSAPVHLDYKANIHDLCFLMAHDDDLYARCTAAQALLGQSILPWIKAGAAGTPPLEIFSLAWGEVLHDDQLDFGVKAAILALPPAAGWHLAQNPIDYQTTAKAVRKIKLFLATTYYDTLLALYENLRQHNRPEQQADLIGLRQLKNLCLSYLMATELPEISHLADQQLRFAELMADQMAALALLAACPKAPEREEALLYFAEKWHDHPLLLQKWLAAQAVAYQNAAPQIKELARSPYYQAKVPNFIRALWGSFTRNYENFHREEGQQLLAEQVLKIDRFNPQIAASLAKVWRDFPRYLPAEQSYVGKLLQHLRRQKLSPNLQEVITQILASGHPAPPRPRKK